MAYPSDTFDDTYGTPVVWSHFPLTVHEKDAEILEENLEYNHNLLWVELLLKVKHWNCCKRNISVLQTVLFHRISFQHFSCIQALSVQYDHPTSTVMCTWIPSHPCFWVHIYFCAIIFEKFLMLLTKINVILDFKWLLKGKQSHWPSMSISTSGNINEIVSRISKEQNETRLIAHVYMVLLLNSRFVSSPHLPFFHHSLLLPLHAEILN